MSSRAGRGGEVTLEGYLGRWSGLHGGVPPTGLVGLWLRLVYRTVRPLAALRVPPSLVTVAGLLLVVLAMPAAPSLPWLAGLLVVLGGLCDSLDGALAVVRGRVSTSGAVLDGVCDRLGDLALVGALWLAGASGWVCVASGVVGFLHEYLRELTASRGVGVITVSERPTRIIVAAAFLLAAGAHPFGTAAAWAGAGAVILLIAGTIGFAQLALIRLRP